MHDKTRMFFADECGAVTVDWVVLTAAIVALGIAVIASISGGANDLARYISSALTDAEVATLEGLETAGTGN